MYTRCPHCNQKFQIETELENEELLCSKCQQSFSAVPALFCEHCGTLESSKQRKCSNCGTQLLDLKRYRKRKNILCNIPPLEWIDEDDSVIYSVSKFTRVWIRIWAALGMLHAIAWSIGFLVKTGADASTETIIVLGFSAVCFIGISGTVYSMMFDSAMPNRVIYWTFGRKLQCAAFGVLQMACLIQTIVSWKSNQVPMNMKIVYIIATLLFIYTLYRAWSLFAQRATEQEHEISSPFLTMISSLIRKKSFWYSMVGIAVIVILSLAAVGVGSHMRSPEYQYKKWSSAKTDKNLSHLKNAVARGYLPAIVDYAAYAEQKNNYADATAMWRKLADAGNDSACYKLGKSYAEGMGVEKNNSAAIAWLRKAAEKGHPEAPAPLGGLLYEEKEYQEAVKWLREAADFGDIRAKYYLGIAYLYGNGVTKDPRSSVQLFKVAAEQDLPEAQFALGTCLLNGTGCTRNVADGVKLITQAAENNFPQAQYRLGMLYENGEGVEKSPTKAFKWYREAATRKFASARVAVAYAYLNGTGIEQDVERGLNELTVLAQENNSYAQFLLGCAYYNGKDIEKNLNEAFKWILKSAENNHQDAIILLGGLYLSGEGCEKDILKAIAWWKKLRSPSPEIIYFMVQYERHMKYSRLTLINVPVLGAKKVRIPAVLQYLQEKSIADSGIKFILPSYTSARLTKVVFSMRARNRNLLQIVDAICMVGDLKFTLKDDNVSFESHFTSKDFSQTSSGSAIIDQSLKEQKFQVRDDKPNSITQAMEYLADGLVNSVFTIVWLEDESFDKKQVSFSKGNTNLLSHIQEFCKQGNLKFHVFNDVILFQAK